MDVPLDWMRNKATRKACIDTSIRGSRISRKCAVRHTIEMGVTSLATDGFATAIPPTALVTDTAGVKTPSASVRLVPNKL